MLRLTLPSSGRLTVPLKSNVRVHLMPSCILRVSGSTAKVRRFLAASAIQPIHTFWRGDPGVPKSRGPVKTSGFNIELSAADGLAAQVTQAAKFIRRHKENLLLIQSIGFSSSTIDFGLYEMATEDKPWPSYRLSASFVHLASEIGCAIDLSFYGAPPDAS